jgi:hypothetical protein
MIDLKTKGYTAMIDLKTKGYTVISNFLDQEEIDMFLADYNQVKSNIFSNHPQPISLMTDGLSDKILSKLNQVAMFSGLTVDMLDPQGLYTSTDSMNMGWHQDHQSYYFFQQSYNYLNFYLILEKEDPTLSGLSVIPFDALTNLTPNYANELINSGAKRFHTIENITKVFDDNYGGEWNLPFDIDSIKESPELSAGDLLLIRGDVIHKTQDVLTKRLALSIRFFDSCASVSFEKLQQGGLYKKNWLKDFKFDLVFKETNSLLARDFLCRMGIVGQEHKNLWQLDLNKIK